MKAYMSIVAAAAVAAASIVSGCTNVTSSAGTVNTYYDGTIKDLEVISIDSNKYNTSTNALAGALGGALVGNLLNGHSTGTFAGGIIGAAIGGFGSKIANNGEGLRLNVETSNGPLMVDVPFNCSYAKGKKVRLISGSSQGTVQLYKNGKYVTLTEDPTSKCPAVYQRLKAN